MADLRPTWFAEIWDNATEIERQRLRDKASWERMSLMAVMREWPSLVPGDVRHLVPGPDPTR